MVNIGMNRYENGKIYKITDVGYNKCYIGSTCESLSKRMERHRKQYKEYIKGRMKKKTTAIDIFNEFGIENCTIELIENYPCQSKEELFKREGGHIKATECVNRQIAGRTQQEWKLDNPEQAREYYERGKARARAYYHKHKEEIIEKRRLNEEKIIEQRLLKVECPFCKR
jgi:hypothetical protein